MKRMNANVKFKKENEVVTSMVKCTKKYSEATFIIYSINNHLFNVENSKLNYFKNLYSLFDSRNSVKLFLNGIIRSRC